MKKILVICPYPKDTTAGQRLKYEQYIADWEASGYEVELSPFMSDEMRKIVYKKGYTLNKIGWTLLGYLKRTRDIFRLKNYDLIYVFMYVTPLGASFYEKIFRKQSKKVIFDLEDNRFVGTNIEKQSLTQRMRGATKTEFLVKTADHVISSSPALNDVCRELNDYNQSTYISSSINTERFVPNNSYRNDHKIVIGWTGTFSTQLYLDLLRPVFIELKKHRDFKLIVIGDFEYEFPEMDLEVIQWTAQNEIADLQKFDIGVYPLTTDEWVMGKSGLKAIQYMSFGLPCVATDVSTVQQFIVTGENGFLVKTEDEWVVALTELIDDAALRKRIGENARQTVLERFSKHVIKKQYLSILDETTKND